MGEIAADADLFGMGLMRGAGGAGVVVAEGQPVVHVVGDGLNARPAGRGAPEQPPGHIRHGFGFAVAAAQQIDERLVRQFVDRVLDGHRRRLVRKPAVPDQEVGAEAHAALRRDQPMTGVAEAVAVRAQAHALRGLDDLGCDEVVQSLGPDAEHQDHRGWRGAVEGDLVAGADEHSNLPGRSARPRQATLQYCEGSDRAVELETAASDSTATSTCMCRKSAASPK